MKTVIVGPGAIGSLFSAFLARSKEEVWLLDKDKERARKISKKGITVEGVSGNWQVKVGVSADPREIGRADLIIICVKSYDTKEAIIYASSLIDKDTQVLTLQNGLGNIESIGKVVGPKKVIGGLTNQGATLIEPGHIRHAGRGETVIGRLDGRLTPEISRISEIFNRAGLETRISKDIEGILWSKLIINCGINAITAITRLNNGRLVEFETTRRILREAVVEAVKVAKKRKIKLIYDDPVAKAESICRATKANVSSMLQDVLRERRTEIDFINGVIVQQGESLKVPTPVNSILVDLVKTTEATYNLRVE